MARRHAHRGYPGWMGDKSVMMVLALLAGVLFLAPLICVTHLPSHGQMGLSHGLCVSVITLAVGAALTVPLLDLLFSAPARLYAPYLPLIRHPIHKPPQ